MSRWMNLENLSWTRTRPHDNTHIAQDWLAESLYYNGLSILDPSVQKQSLAFAWSRKFCKPNQQLLWTRILETTLINLNRPTIQQQITLQVTERQRVSRQSLHSGLEPFHQLGTLFNCRTSLTKIGHLFQSLVTKNLQSTMTFPHYHQEINQYSISIKPGSEW